MKARFADLGGTVIAGSSAEFGKLIAEESEKWGKVIKAAGIKAENRCCYAKSEELRLCALQSNTRPNNR
jgi:hypothetical protein